MFGALSLLICLLTGAVWFDILFLHPSSALPDRPPGEQPRGDGLDRGRLSLFLAGSWVVGTVVLGSFVYFLAALFAQSDRPLFYANCLVFILTLYMLPRGARLLAREFARVKCSRIAWWRDPIFFYFVIATLVSLRFNWHTFDMTTEHMRIGYSVLSDFGPHVSLIRSFSEGMNLPAQYPLFACDPIGYHFLFYFFVGNLEWLGLRIDWALNTASVLSCVSLLMLLLVLNFRIFGSLAVCWLVLIFFFTRSSFAFFKAHGHHLWAADLRGLFDQIVTATRFIGETPGEAWGLWSINDLANQRHFCLGVCVLLIVILRYLPDGAPANGTEAGRGICARFVPGLIGGILLGLSGYWHGATYVSALLILSTLAVWVRDWQNLFLTLAISLALVLMQNLLFVPPSAGALPLRLRLGFIAPERTVTGVLAYYIEAFGVLIPLQIAALLVVSLRGKSWIWAFVTPFVFANLFTLTADPMVNAKYLRISIILAGGAVAWLLVSLWAEGKMVWRGCVSILLVLLTITGVENFLMFESWNRYSVNFERRDPLALWAATTKPDALFLTPEYSEHPILFAGRKIFAGYNYFTHGTGHDFVARHRIAGAIYEARSPEEVFALLEEQGINYVVIDDQNRRSSYYKVNEEFFDRSFDLVYKGELANIKVYRVGRNQHAS